MNVLDASAAVDLLLNTAAGSRIAVRLAGAGTLHSPHLIDIEITQTLRRLLARAEISKEHASLALDHWVKLDVERYTHASFLDRIWGRSRIIFQPMTQLTWLWPKSCRHR